MAYPVFGSDRAQRCWQWLIGGALALACAAALAQPPGKTLELTVEERASAQLQAGYLMHVLGNYERAIELFRASIEAQPTAEAHTYLGWSMSHLGKIEEAIAQCKIAIEIDPGFGNPYNDIGVYLIALERLEEAIPWLEKAMVAKRYCCYPFPYFNLGRILVAQGKVEEARRAFEGALKHDPTYEPALQALEFIKQRRLRGL
jgi:tetratricopeptide (TPR) repeat protein